MKKISPYLTFAGTIPFILGAVFISVGVDAIAVLGQTVQVLAVYGLVIASFMAGAHWGNHLGVDDDNHWAVRLPIISNIIALLLWLGFLVLAPAVFMWLLIAAFIAMLMVDYGLQRAQIISDAYLKIRLFVTMIVVIALVVVAVQL